MRKVAKNVSLIILMLSISSAVANWGNEITENPVVVTIALFVSGFVYAVADALTD